MITKLILWLSASVVCFALVFAGYFFIQYEIPMYVTLIHLAWVCVYFGFVTMLFIAALAGLFQAVEKTKELRRRICKYGNVRKGCVITL